MFGYVNAYKDLLRVCDYNVFRGYYCGLCKQLGKSFNQLTRFGLSYDMTFLASPKARAFSCARAAPTRSSSRGGNTPSAPGKTRSCIFDSKYRKHLKKVK